MINYIKNSIKILPSKRYTKEEELKVLEKYHMDLNKIFSIDEAILEQDLKQHIGLLLYLIIKHKEHPVCYLGESFLEKSINKVVRQFNYLEIRFLGEFKGKKCYFMDIRDLTYNNIKEKIEEITHKIKTLYHNIEEKNKGRDYNITGVYVGIAPRKEKDGTSPSATAWAYITFDIDFEDWKTNRMPTIDEIKERLITYLSKFIEKGIYPHKILFTGGGFRFIILPDRPILGEELPLLEQIAEQIGADTKIYDKVRVDRLPGTLNRKEDYGTPRPCITIGMLKDVEDSSLISPVVLYEKFGVIPTKKDFENIINEVKEEKVGINNLHKATKKLLKKPDIKREVLNDVDDATYKWLFSIQCRLYKKLGVEWVEKLLQYLGIDYRYKIIESGKAKGKVRLDLWSLYFDDGRHPDCSIYLNNGYNAIMVDFHDPNMRFIVLAGLWICKELRPKINEFLNINGLSYVFAKEENDEYKLINEFFKLGDNVVEYRAEDYIGWKDIKKILDEHKDRILGIKAPTGAGKTTSILNYAVNEGKNIIFLVPYYSTALQQAIQNKIKGYIGLYQDDKQPEEAVKRASKIIATYDQLERIINIKGKEALKNYILAVDEWHNLFTQYDLRYKPINNILNAMDLFQRVILVSGTYEGLNIFDNKIIEFKTNKVRRNNYTIKVFKKGEGLNYLIEQLKSIDPSKGKTIVFLNNIDVIEQIAQYLNSYGINAYTIHSGKKQSPIMEAIYNEEKLLHPGVYLCTSVICDGINLNDEDIERIFIYGVKDIYQIAQFIARFRKVEPPIIHIIEPHKVHTKGVLYKDYVEEIRKVIVPIINTLNLNRREAKEKGILEEDTEVYKEIASLPIFKEEKYIQFDKYKEEYKEDLNKITYSYIELLNERILNNPQLLKRALLKFYPELNISIVEREENKKEENNEEDTKIDKKRTKEELINYIKTYGIDKITYIKSSKKDPIKLGNETNISPEEIEHIKEVCQKHHKALKKVLEIMEYKKMGLDIHIPEKHINKVKEKYNLPDEDTAKLVYVLVGNRRTIGKELEIINTAKNIILENGGWIKKRPPINIKEWDYRIRKHIIDRMVEAYKTGKNLDMPTLLKELRQYVREVKESGVFNEKDKNRLKIERKRILDIIKTYGTVKIKKESVKVISIDERILTALNTIPEKRYIDYNKVLSELNGKELYEDEILEALGGDEELFNKLVMMGVLLRTHPGRYLVNV